MPLRFLFKIIMVAAIAGAGYLLYSTLSQYSLDEILEALNSIPFSHLTAALGFAACSYLCLACSDALAVRYAGGSLPFHQTTLASFTALSIGHNVGVAALSSGAVRYRFYSRWGLSMQQVAKIIVFCGVTVALGISTVGALGFYLRPEDAARMTGFGADAISLAGILCLAFPVLYLILAATVRKPLHFRKWNFAMPKLPIAAGQVAVGTANFSFVAACLHQILSGITEAGYIKVAAASITANIAAIASHVPGGIGVLEATIAYIIPGAASVAAVIAYRVIYYFVPLGIGLPLLLASEFYYRGEADDPELEKNAQKT